MTPEEWRQKAAADRPAPSAALLEQLRPLITHALPRAQAAPAPTGAAASTATETQQNPGGNTQ